MSDKREEMWEQKETGSEHCQCQKAINKMTHEIHSILSDCEPSVYLYGSLVLDDFRPGWSDIDILVLTDRQISEEQAQKLVNLRQTMSEKEPGNPYYRLFEGGMLTLDAGYCPMPVHPAHFVLL